MSYAFLSYEQDAHVVHISLNRPARLNALNEEMIRELDDAFDEFDLDEEAWVAIVSGTGRCFSTGADVGSQSALLREGRIDELYRKLSSRKPHGFLDCINWKPVIAAVHGHCMGMALGLVLDADVIVVAEDAMFRVAEVERSVGGGSLGVRLAQAGCGRVGTELALTGRDMPGSEAFRLGLAARLATDRDQMLAAARDVAAQMLRHPPLGVRANVRVGRLSRSAERAHLRFAADDVGRLSRTEDYRAAAAAFAEKAEPPPYRAR